MNPEVLFGTSDPDELLVRKRKFVQTMENLPAGKGVYDPESGGQVFKAQGWDNPALRMLAMLDESPALNKALSADLAESLRTQLTDVQKDLSLTSPLSTGYVAYDLKPTIEQIFFAETPLRNRITRTQGHGKNVQIKRITGFTGAVSTGNVGVFHPGITDATQTRFDNPGSSNALYLNRPAKISYAGEEVSYPYVQMGASDELSWSTQLASLGFADMRAISRTSLMLSSMVTDERLLLTNRGTQTGYLGALSAPAQPTGAARTKTATETGISGATTNVYVKVTAVAGEFGQSVLSTASAAIAVTNGQVVDVTIPDVAGAVGYNVFVSTGASDPGDASRWFAGTTGYNTFTIQGALPTSGTAASSVTADTTAYAQGFDGILPIVTGTHSGYKKRLNDALNTTNPGSEFQDAFVSLWNSVRARPSRFLIAGQDFKQLNEAIRNGGSGTSYRLTVDQSQVSSVTVGNVIAAIINEVTGGDVTPEVHPYMPQGNVAILTDQLPMPSQGVTDIWEYRLVQDMMAVEWPVIQFSYDASTYWFGTFFCHAPAYQGSIQGIKAA